MYQNVPANCFTPSKWYTVHARVLLRSAFEGQPFYCDPTILWGNNVKSCPTVNIKMLNGPAQEIAWTMGRNLDEHIAREDEGWMNLEGAFQYPTSNEMKGEGAVDVISVTRAPLGVDILLDYVYIEPMQDAQSVESFGMRTCETNLIANGDAETGDHRFWFIRGTGSDTNESIQISPSRFKQYGFGYYLGLSTTMEEDTGAYAFKHVGYRNERWRGMIQKIDASCLKVGSVWTITASFRYFATDWNGNESPASCNLDNHLADNSCPVFDIEFISPKVNDPSYMSTGPMKNEVTDDYSVRTPTRLDEWNEIVHTLTITGEMAKHTEAYIFVNAVDAGYNYELDDVVMKHKS